MEAVATGIQDASLLAQELNSDVNHFTISTGAQLSTKETLEKAKTDHPLWKSRIMNMLAGLENVPPDEVTSHHDCR